MTTNNSVKEFEFTPRNWSGSPQTQSPMKSHISTIAFWNSWNEKWSRTRRGCAGCKDRKVRKTMFENLPTVDEKLEFDENDNPILPATHTAMEFYAAAGVVETFKEKYQSYGVIDPTQIDGQDYLNIWRVYINENAMYVRPDILVAAVHGAVSEIISDVLNDPWSAIQDRWEGETELDRAVEAVAKRVTEQEATE